MWAIYQRYREFRLALEAGDYRRAARLVIEILDLLIPEDPSAVREPVGTVAEQGAFTEETFKEDVKAVKAALPKKATPKAVGAVGSGGAIVIALLTTFGPLLVELIRKRLKEQGG